MYCHVENKLTGKVYLWRAAYDDCMQYIAAYRGEDWCNLVIR